MVDGNLIFSSSNGSLFVSKGVIICVCHECESKGVTSLLITPVPQLSVPGFAASKVGSPWLGVLFCFYHFFLFWPSIGDD